MRNWLALLWVAFSLMAAGASATAPVDGERVETERQEEPLDALHPELGEGRIISGTTAHRTLHFTFDDGPARSLTPALLDQLDRYGVRATFFLVARRLEHPRDRAIALQIRDRGHSIGLHSHEHDDVSLLSVAALNEDLDRSEALFMETFGARPVLFRPPYGHHNTRSDGVLSERGYTQVLWNLHGGDITGRTADDVVETFRAMLDRGPDPRRSARAAAPHGSGPGPRTGGDADRAEPIDPRGAGGVVLLHDTHRWTVEAFPRLMEEIASRNCAALASGEELWDVAPDLSPWYQARGGASASRSARRMRLDAERFETRQAELRAAAEERCG